MEAEAEAEAERGHWLRGKKDKKRKKERKKDDSAKIVSFLEYRSHQRLRERSPDELTCLRAQYLSAIFAYLGDAAAKGTIMRFMGIPQPRLIPPPPRCTNVQHFLPVSYAGAIAGFPVQPRRPRTG